MIQDGVSVAKSISYEDKYKNVGETLAKRVAKGNNAAADDGILYEFHCFTCSKHELVLASYYLFNCYWISNLKDLIQVLMYYIGEQMLFLLAIRGPS